MPASRYIVVLNTIAAFFDWFGRFFAFKPYSKAWVFMTFVLSICVDSFMIYFYFGDLNKVSEGLCFLCFPLAAYTLFRTALGITYFMIQANIKANDSNRDAIGAIMSNILQFGICCGNLISLTLSRFKGN